METRRYLIIPTTQLSKVVVNELCGESKEDFRKSVDGTKVLVKWDKETPSFYGSLTGKQGPYTLEEILPILETKEWVLDLSEKKE
jgi:hypothetical protein